MWMARSGTRRPNSTGTSHTAHRHRIFIPATRDREAPPRTACRGFRPAPCVVSHWLCRNARNRGKSVDTSWAIHSACSIHSVRRDGGSVFHGACTSRPFLHASSQPRRGGGSLLLHFLVSIRSRRRRVEYRREPRPQVTDGASLLKLDS